MVTLDRIGFAGEILPINPKYEELLGRRCYPGVADLPAAPDVVVFCVGHGNVLEPLKAAAARGAGGAVIYDGGFAERGGEGLRLQDEIAGICREAGIALC